MYAVTCLARRESSSVPPLAEFPAYVERYIKIAQALVPLELAWRVGAVFVSVGRRPFAHSIGVVIVR